MAFLKSRDSFEWKSLSARYHATSPQLNQIHFLHSQLRTRIIVQALVALIEDPLVVDMASEKSRFLFEGSWRVKLAAFREGCA